MRKFLTAFIFTASSVVLTTAQTRKPASSGQPQVVEATKQFNKLRANGSTFTQLRVVLVWKSATPPATGFFIRSGNEWKETTLAKPERRSFGAGSPNDYMMVEAHIEPGAIKAGDRLTITSHRHDHDDEVMPEAVKKMTSSGVFYAVGTGKNQVWKAIPVQFKTLPERVQ